MDWRKGKSDRFDTSWPYMSQKSWGGKKQPTKPGEDKSHSRPYLRRLFTAMDDLIRPLVPFQVFVTPVCACGGAALLILTGDPPTITVNSALARKLAGDHWG